MQYQLTNLASEQALQLIASPDQKAVLQATVHDKTSARRAEIERFIQQTFASYYQASILQFYPHLLAAFDNHAAPYAAIGYRHASQQRLFLEQYLDAPVEHTLNLFAGECYERSGIVEIGNLAATRPGSCLNIFQLLSLYFHRSDIQWVVFTATHTVRVVLKRLRIDVIELASASAAQVECEQHWGSYYQQQPVVMAAPVAQAISNISQRYQLQLA